LLLALAGGPALAVAQPIVQPAPPIVQPAPPGVQPAPPIVQPAPPVVQPAPPVVQPAPAAVPIGPAPAPGRAGRGGRSMLWTGLWLAGVSHGAAVTVAFAAGPSDPTAWWLLLPVGGPAVWGAILPCHGDSHDRKACRALTATGGGFWSAIQLGGFLATLGGALEMGREDAPAARLWLSPLSTREARGLAVQGTF